jgi:hypothetical protein
MGGSDDDKPGKAGWSSKKPSCHERTYTGYIVRHDDSQTSTGEMAEWSKALA